MKDASNILIQKCLKKIVKLKLSFIIPGVLLLDDHSLGAFTLDIFNAKVLYRLLSKAQ